MEGNFIKLILQSFKIFLNKLQTYNEIIDKKLKQNILFIMKKILAVMFFSLLMSGNSNACKKEDFTKYISAGKNKCIAMLNVGEIEKGKKNLIVFLHGDGRPNPKGQKIPKRNHIRFVEELINDDNNTFIFARPGYFIRESGSSEENRYSSGPRDPHKSTIKNYNWKKFRILAPALENLRKHYKPEKLILIGHSGGAYQGGTIHGKVPGLVDINILISCPCDWELRKKLSKGKKWETKSQLKKLKNHSPSFNYQDIDPKSLNVLIVGKDDKNTPPGVSEYYYDLLKEKNKQVKLHIIDGGHGLRSMPTIGSVVNEYIN